MIDSVVAYMKGADPESVYAVLFISAYLENIIPPIPGDIPVTLVGSLLVFNNITFVAALFWSTFGSVAGFMTVFFLSRFLGLKLYAEGSSEVRHKFALAVHKLFPPSEMDLVRRKFSGHGYLAVLINRFFLGSRAVICIVAGMLHLNVFLVFLGSVASSLVWNMLLLYGGLLLGKNWDQIGQYVLLYSVPFSLFFSGFIVWSIIRHVKKRKLDDPDA